GPAGGPASRWPNGVRSNAEQWHRDVCRCYTRATGRPKKPSVQRGGQCLNGKIWQLTPPVVEQRPIRFFPCASFGLPAPCLLLAANSLFNGPYGGKVRKVRKARICCAVAARGIAVRQVWVWLFLASFNSALNGFHRGAMTVLP